ncbi:hypothetical protein [Hypericibacter sp.]|uniref:hypothetical protein n=1 Tax=Hypericibacter sp. TaxID=2705401 RepID=UPI003D6D09B7
MAWYRTDDGKGVMHIKFDRRGEKNKPKPCLAPFELDDKTACQRMSAFLCDWPVGNGKTCDEPICATHAFEVGPDRHYCPRHTREHLDRTTPLDLASGRKEAAHG